MRFRIIVGILYVLFAFVVLGCQAPKKPSPAKPVHLADELAPSPARKAALADIRELEEYLIAQEVGAQGFVAEKHEVIHMDISEGENKQSFSVDGFGHVDLQNISLEDAFLVLVGEQARERLAELKDSPQVLQPQQEFEQDEEKASAPPSKLNDGNKVYMVKQVVWLGGDLETTDCKNHEIDVLMTDGAKRAGMLHEMMHVVTGCDLKTPGLHQAIYKLAGPLLKLMQDNPEMMDYLLKRKSIASTKGSKDKQDVPVQWYWINEWQSQHTIDLYSTGHPLPCDVMTENLWDAPELPRPWCTAKAMILPKSQTACTPLACDPVNGCNACTDEPKP